MDALGVMRRVFYALFDAVLPPHERVARTKTRTIQDIPVEATMHELLGVQITTILNYRHTATQDLIQALKYDGSGAAAALSAAALGDYLREQCAEEKQFSPRPIVLVPVPLHPSRQRERGFNQVALVLKTLPKEFHDGTLSVVASNMLIRVRATRPQTKLPRHARMKNMAGAFGVPNPSTIANVHIFLIDDVATTGATLKAAGAPLKQCGADVTLLALARA